MSNVFTVALFLPVTVLLYWVFVPAQWRNLFLCACSLFVVFSISFHYSVYLLFTLCCTFIAGIYCGRERDNRKTILQCILIWLIGCLCFFKYAPGIMLPLGFSYITFRLIHYIVEAYRGNIPKTSFPDFVLYVLFFPTFFAGPIERFQNFHPRTLDKKTFEISAFNYGLYRIACGVIKKVLIVYYLTRLVMPALRSPETFSRPIVIMSAYGLAMLIYMDFSGYTDIAVGSSRLFGYTITENFNYPFFKKNIALFWRNWHISLYTWMRDYFFFPLFGSRASTFKLYSGIAITVMVMHFWHEISLNFFILGFFHITGLTVWHLFQRVKNRFPLWKSADPCRWLDAVSTVFTFSFVSVGFVLFYFDTGHSLRILKRIFM